MLIDPCFRTEVLRRHQAGQSTYRIATEMQTSRATVNRILRDNGIEPLTGPSPGGIYGEDPTEEQIAEIAERTRQVREVGFFGRAQTNTSKVFYPPWSASEEKRRRVDAPQPVGIKQYATVHQVGVTGLYRSV
jgi:hypothetical protein